MKHNGKCFPPGDDCLICDDHPAGLEIERLRSALHSEANQTAFSVPDSTGFDGVTKREYFAAMAMQGFVSHGLPPEVGHARLAASAIACADALLLALEQTK